MANTRQRQGHGVYESTGRYPKHGVYDADVMRVNVEKKTAVVINERKASCHGRGGTGAQKIGNVATNNRRRRTNNNITRRRCVRHMHRSRRREAVGSRTVSGGVATTGMRRRTYARTHAW